MLQKNKERIERRQKRLWQGRPVRFDKDTHYDRKKEKEESKKEIEENAHTDE